MMATDNSLEISEEELLDYSCSSDCDDTQSLCMSDAGDLLDNDLLYESIGHSVSNSQMVLKPSQRNPITAPKPSYITPITSPDIVPTTSLSLPVSQTPPAHKLTRTVPVKTVKTTRITFKPTMMSKKQLPNHTISQRTSPIGAPGEKKVLKQFQKSPVKAPTSHRATINTTKCSGRMLPRMASVAEDFVFSTSTKSPMVASDSEESSDDMPYYSRYYDARIRDSEPYGCSNRSRQDNHTSMEPSLSTSSSSLDTNPFNMASSANDGSPFSFGARETTSKRQCRSLDSSPSVSTTNSGNSPGNPFSPQRDLDSSSSVGLPTHRMVDYSASSVLTAQGNHAGVTRKKSKVIKLNQPKVFRYVPEDLPEVELPNLMTKKRSMRKRGNSYPGDDCPDLLLETKRHVGEGDLRSVLTTQRTNKSSTFNSEGPSTSESQKKVSQAISYPHCTSCKGAEPSREACSRQYSPIIAPTMQDSHIQSPSSSPVKSSGVAAIATTGLQPQKERTFATGMSDDLHQQKPSIFQCVSIFAQRPNLIGRSSPGLNQFSLRHLDGPTCRSFALDHL